MRLTALAEIYTIHFFAQLCNLIVKFVKFCKHMLLKLKNSAKIQLGKSLNVVRKILSNSSNLFFNVILELSKGVHCVDLGESFPTQIILQNLASIQPRTSLVKCAASRVKSAVTPKCR